MSYDRIRVLVTPLHYDGIYGDVIDITKDVDVTAFVKDNIGSIKTEIDNGDYDIGVFTFGSIKLSCYNDEGRFAVPEDPRSLFKYKRDLTQVKIIYLDADNVRTTIFEGLINEDTTRDEDLPDDDITSGMVRFRVLSLDSIFRHVEVAGGAIATGISLSDAIKQILNTTAITRVLNFDANNIAVDTDVPIDNGEYFTAKTVKEALDELLLAANAVLLIDANKNIIVTPRTETETVHRFYAPHDPLNRGDILEIKGYNSGLHRCFSAVEVNETEVIDQPSIDDYGYRQKSISLDFIDNTDNEETIGQAVLDEFHTPRLECEVKLPLADSAQCRLRDQVVLDYPLRVIPPGGQDYVTTVNTFIAGQSHANRVSGSIEISPKVRWKIIGIRLNTRNLTTQLKLRQIGKKYGQGIVSNV